MLCYKDKKKKNFFLTPMTKTGVGVARCQVTNSTLIKIHLHCCVTSAAGFAFYGLFFFFFFFLGKCFLSMLFQASVNGTGGN